MENTGIKKLLCELYTLNIKDFVLFRVFNYILNRRQRIVGVERMTVSPSTQTSAVRYAGMSDRYFVPDGTFLVEPSISTDIMSL